MKEQSTYKFIDAKKTQTELHFRQYVNKALKALNHIGISNEDEAKIVNSWYIKAHLDDSEYYNSAAYEIVKRRRNT
jgi:hypothetical protein